MKYELLTSPFKTEGKSTVETVLLNRGIAPEDIETYLNTTDEVISDYLLLGEENLGEAFMTIYEAMESDLNCMVIVDSDCDGFTSAAILINCLYDHNPEWVNTHLQYYMHKGKQHGLRGVEIPDEISLVIVPDAGSNDYEEHKDLLDEGKRVIVLDHHEADKISGDAIVINNQLSDYPNKSMSGAGIVWQFCRYMDSKMHTDYAERYVDLMALGMMADMMSLKSIETKHLILKGLQKDLVTNPFFFSMAEKNSFSLKGELTPMGVAFYIAPFVNAMVRSGTQEEKSLLFNSMLRFKAFERVPSTKRGHKAGDEERVVDQAIRVATNVKNRQTRSQEAGLELLEGLISKHNLLDNKVLLLQIEPGDIQQNIAGLVANKFMARFQRNTAILTKGKNFDGQIIWQGSARGYSKSGVASFRDLCEETGVVEYAQGHAGAFGLGILDKNIDKFIQITNEKLKDDTGEAIYYVDYEFSGSERFDAEHIMRIAELNYLWGAEMPEALVAIKNLKITKDMITLMSPDKKPTIKINLPNGVNILKFKSSQEEYDSLYSENGYIEITLVGTSNKNEWNGIVTPQIFMSDYEIVDSNKYIF